MVTHFLGNEWWNIGKNLGKKEMKARTWWRLKSLSVEPTNCIKLYWYFLIVFLLTKLQMFWKYKTWVINIPINWYILAIFKIQTPAQACILWKR